MEWWQIFLFLLIVYFAYSAGHWVGYGKGEQDTRELTEEIRKLNKKRDRYLRWSRKPPSNRVRNLRAGPRANSRSEIKSRHHWWETASYKTGRKHVPASVYIKSFDKE